MIKTGIIGATGYAGQQLVSLLINHPEAEVTFVSSNSYAGQSFSDIYPQFYRILDQKLLSTEEAKAAIGDVDVVFTALPNGLVFEIAEIAMEKGTKIVDFSADFVWTIRRSTRNGIKRSILRRSSSAGRSTVCRSCGETGSATHSSWPIRDAIRRPASWPSLLS